MPLATFKKNLIQGRLGTGLQPAALQMFMDYKSHQLAGTAAGCRPLKGVVGSSSRVITAHNLSGHSKSKKQNGSGKGPEVCLRSQESFRGQEHIRTSQLISELLNDCLRRLPDYSPITLMHIF
uniref:Uncharacterized protein n=1 Tax=Sphaerodactylus townsendi TaxID=933632 RepID=A0ACB8E923_9SAUR